jgi:glycosyltransferase involved in cell wall biosynthesis
LTILYFYQYFSTSEGAWGTRVYEFSRRWVAQGHKVTVVTSIYSKSDLRPTGFVSDQVVEGITVKVINVRIDNKQPALKRMWTFMVYATISSWFAITSKADIVIASSGPITVGIPALAAKWFRGRKMIFEARDLWPEGAVNMGMLKNKLLIRAAYLFEKICYLNSKAIVALSPGIQNDILARFPRARVTSVTNAANIALFSAPSEAPLAGLHSYAIYFGNLGEVNHSHFLLDAAALLLNQGRNDISIVLIGDGQLKSQLKERAASESLSNVRFFDLMPKSLLVAWVQHALASVVPLKPLPVFDTSSPNKLFESMAAGVPVIQTTRGWIRDFIAEHRTGFTVDAGAPQSLTEKLIELKDNPQLAAEMGRRGREAAVRFFDKDTLADKMIDILKSVHES